MATTNDYQFKLTKNPNKTNQVHLTKTPWSTEKYSTTNETNYPDQKTQSQMHWPKYTTISVLLSPRLVERPEESQMVRKIKIHCTNQIKKFNHFIFLEFTYHDTPWHKTATTAPLPDQTTQELLDTTWCFHHSIASEPRSKRCTIKTTQKNNNGKYWWRYNW